jgi:hypothetical protein
MTTLIPFIPSATSNPPFSTPLTLDATSYAGVATWNIVGNRWYLTIVDQSGNVIWSGAMVGSPNGFDIPLAPGIFQRSTILFRADTGNLEVIP